MKKITWGCLFAAGLALSAHASIASAAGTFGRSPIEFRVKSGYLMGESGEYVYDAYGLGSGIPGYKVSQLDWKIDGAFMAGIGASYAPINRLRFNADYMRNVIDGEGTMDDYDWLYVGLDWSHWSRSENTTVDDISSVNVNGELTFFQLDDKQTDFNFLAGYKRDHFKWVAVGGYGTYSIYGYRDAQVIFPDIPGITYEQSFSLPYVGLGVRSIGESDGLPIVLAFKALYSRWVKGNDEDTHHLRNLYFEEEGSGGEWLALSLDLEFSLSESMGLTLGYAFQQYEEIKAETKVTDLTTGIVYYYPGPSAGLDHSSNMITAQFSYRL